MEKDKGRKTMKQNFAILAVTALLICSLTACGGDQNNGAANGNVNGAENGTTSGMTGKTDSSSNVGGELKTVDVNIRRLRIKIESDPTEPEYLTTVWGYGYKWGY